MKSKRNGEIELLRFVFCLLVVLFHINKNIFHLLSANNYTYALSPRGYIGVEFFLMLSGYFMALGIDKKKNSLPLGTDTVRFIWKKYFSIFWYHIIAFCALFVVHTVINKDFSMDKFFDVIPGALLITRSGVRFFDINGVEWYISAMILVMAAMYPVAKKHFEVYAKAIAPISAVLIYGWLIQKYHTLSGTTVWGPLGFRCMWRTAAGLNIGMFMYCCVKALKRHEFSNMEKNVAIIARIIMYASICVYAMCRNPGKYEIYAVGVIFIALTLSFAFPHDNARWLDSKTVLYLGRLSLPLYLNQNLAILLGKTYMINQSDAVIVISIVLIDVILSVICLWLGGKLTNSFNESKLNKIALGIN
ncbi:MAG: acyltransferase [Eubacterium sp.]|nr:acyltransferase [Eubacterium sp.]